MQPALSHAFHLRGADRSTVEAVDQWLARHGLAITTAPDALFTCTHLLLHKGPAPGFAFLGVDWFAPSDFDVVDYLRATWPQTGVIIYGSPQQLPRANAWDRTMVCTSRAKLRDLLALAPSELAQRLMRLALPANYRPAPSPPKNPPTEGPLAAAGRPPEPLGNEAPSQPPPPSPAGPGRGLLTRDELAALLGK